MKLPEEGEKKRKFGEEERYNDGKERKGEVEERRERINQEGTTRKDKDEKGWAT